MTLKIRLWVSLLYCSDFFWMTLILQLKSKIPIRNLLAGNHFNHVPSTGTTIRDYMEIELFGWDYAKGSLMLFLCLMTVLLVWWKTEKSFGSIQYFQTFRPELLLLD